MQQLKKYLLIDCVDNPNYDLDTSDPDYEDISYRIKPRVKLGFKRDKIGDVFNMLPAWTPTGGGQDKLFFFNGCTVPRFKVREHYICTIKPSNATAAFISNEKLGGSDNTFKHYRDTFSVNRTSIAPWLKHLHEAHIKPMIDSILDNNGINEILLSDNLLTNCYHDDSLVTNEDFELGKLLPNLWEIRRDAEKNENQLLVPERGSDLHNMTCPIYLEESVLKYLNQGNVVLDDDKYEEFRAFGVNGEDENVILMMELMANVDYDKSFLNLLFLLKEFGRNIQALKECHHVNFKSLLKFMGLNHKELPDLSLYKMTGILITKQLFTKKNAAMVGMLCANDYFYEDHKDNQIEDDDGKEQPIWIEQTIKIISPTATKLLND